MHLPDYNGGSIVNLMSSIKSIFESDYEYPLLRDFDITSCKGKNIVFIVIDGLGYDFLMEYGNNGFLKSNTCQKITSVFPSTTASAFTSLSTGVAPQQHGLTGWFIFLKETGILTSILPFVSRAGGVSLSKIPFNDICTQESFFQRLKVSSFYILNENYVNSQCSQALGKGARRVAFSNIKSFIGSIKNILECNDERKFIFAYWDKLDEILHREGSKSKMAKEHFNMLDKELGTLAGLLDDDKTAMIVTSDHGIIETSQKRTVNLADHPSLSDNLTLPLSGEPRVSYCYVRPDKTLDFENYISNILHECCDLYKSPDLIGRGFFGLFQPNEKLYQRVGDYTLVMKENYIIKDILIGETFKEFKGVHGGVSQEEMYVPLVVP